MCLSRLSFSIVLSSPSGVQWVKDPASPQLWWRAQLGCHHWPWELPNVLSAGGKKSLYCLSSSFLASEPEVLNLNPSLATGETPLRCRSVSLRGRPLNPGARGPQASKPRPPGCSQTVPSPPTRASHLLPLFLARTLGHYFASVLTWMWCLSC